MSTMPAHVYAFLIGLVGVVGIIVLAATSHPVPSILSTVTIAAVAAGAGIAIPASTTVATSRAVTSPPSGTP